MRGQRVPDDKRRAVESYIDSGLNSVEVGRLTGVSSRSVRRIWEHYIKDRDDERVHAKTIISLGAGVQSSTLYLMACHGEVTPKPDVAIFADTGWEPEAVYRYLDFLMFQGDVPIHRVSAGNIREDALHPEHRFASMPLFTRNQQGKPAMLKRQCTEEYKIQPIQRKIGELVGTNKSRLSVELWLGISYDEITRMKPSRYEFITHRWPLIERRMSRDDCLRWLKEHDYPLPSKSSCIGCPFHDNTYWRDMRDQSPEEFADAVAFDHAIRHSDRFDSAVYLHNSCVPLDEVDFGEAKKSRQIPFDLECTGYCGV